MRLKTGDLVAALSVALALIPQAEAYAALAGVPARSGLYAAALPPIVAAFFASSRYLQTGPVAVTSILTFGALATIAVPESAHYAALAALLALMVGVGRVSFGLLRGGWIAYLMSQPVLLGFTTAAATLIMISQIPTALGVHAPTESMIGAAWWSVTHVGAWEPASVVLTGVTILIILGGSRLHRLFPGVLVAVVVGVAYSIIAGYSGPTVGAMPTGLPPLSLDLPWDSIPILLVPALVIAFVGFAEPTAIARTFAAQDRERWDPNREFLSQGVANLAAGLSGGMPVGGSFARSAINRMAGGRTRWSGAIAGLLILAFLPFANVLSPLPRAILGAIVIAAVTQLISFGKLFQLVRTTRPQALVAWITAGSTIAFAPHVERAVIVGVILSIVVHIWRELPVGVTSWFAKGTLHLEPVGVLFFGSAPALDDALLNELAAHPDAERLVLHLGKLGRIDYSGALVLKSVTEEATQAGLEVAVADVPPQAQRTLAGVLEGLSAGGEPPRPPGPTGAGSPSIRTR